MNSLTEAKSFYFMYLISSKFLKRHNNVNKTFQKDNGTFIVSPLHPGLEKIFDHSQDFSLEQLWTFE